MATSATCTSARATTTQTEQAIRALLAEAGDGRRRRVTEADRRDRRPGAVTPETYLGSERARGWVNGTPPQGGLPEGSNDFGTIGNRVVDVLPANGFALQGKWLIESRMARPRPVTARIDAHFQPPRCYLVMGSPGQDREVTGAARRQADQPAEAGSDVGPDGAVDRRRSAALPARRPPDGVADHILSLEFENGISAYAFTFGSAQRTLSRAC